jgi:hypothetical protein
MNGWTPCIRVNGINSMEAHIMYDRVYSIEGHMNIRYGKMPTDLEKKLQAQKRPISRWHVP